MNTDILIADAATRPLMNAVESGGKLDASGNEVTFVKYLAEPSWISTTLGRGKR